MGKKTSKRSWRPWRTSSKFTFVVLAINTSACRFELISLDFSKHAIVSDVILELSKHLSCPELRNQTYTGLCGPSGHVFRPALPIASVHEKDDVLVAIPEGRRKQECIDSALSILSQSRVSETLIHVSIPLTATRGDVSRLYLSPICLVYSSTFFVRLISISRRKVLGFWISLEKRRRIQKIGL